MNIPKNVLNPRLYARAFKETNAIYGSQTSAYRSMAIVKRYKALGGKYRSKQKTTGGTVRWRKERWIMVLPYVLKGQVIPCGAHDRRKHACRPLKRVTKNTPVTINELLKEHGKRKIAAFARRKKVGSEQVHLFW
jgi:hypothetical protein